MEVARGSGVISEAPFSQSWSSGSGSQQRRSCREPVAAENRRATQREQTFRRDLEVVEKNMVREIEAIMNLQEIWNMHGRLELAPNESMEVARGSGVISEAPFSQSWSSGSGSQQRRSCREPVAAENRRATQREQTFRRDLEVVEKNM